MTGCWGCARHTVRRSPGNSGRRKFFSLTRRSFRRYRDDKSVSALPDPNDAARALLALYDQALPMVYGYFVRRCADRGTAEDLTSETFLAAMDAARKDDPPPIGVPWLIGVARHKLADHYRRRHDRLTVLMAELPEPVDSVDNWDAELDRLVAESVLTRLSEPHRAVLALRYMDDCSVPECAELIGRTVHATEALLVRARRAFKQHYPEGGTS
jgi:RNA polymerase sigma-70 factor, ECF subfamily